MVAFLSVALWTVTPLEPVGQMILPEAPTQPSSSPSLAVAVRLGSSGRRTLIRGGSVDGEHFRAIHRQIHCHAWVEVAIVPVHVSD